MRKFKLYSILILLTVFTVQINAQNLKKGLKYLTKCEIIDAYTIFKEGITVNPNCPISNYGLAVIYSEKVDTVDFFKAYNFIQKSKENINQLVSNNDYKKLDDYIIADTILFHEKKIDLLLSNFIMKSKNIDYVKLFIINCVNSKYLKNIIELRDSLEFELCDKQNNINEYNKYLKTFPESKYFKKATSKRDFIILENIKKENSLTSLKNFIHDYPNSDYVKDAQSSYILLDYSNVVKKKSISECNRFINEYPNSQQSLKCKELLENLEYENLTDKSSVKDYEDYIHKYPDSKHILDTKQQLQKLEYTKALSSYTLNDFDSFLKKYPDSTTIYYQKIDSAYKLKVELNKIFPNADKYKIVFIRKSNLWIMNEDGTSQKQITSSNKVISFTTNSNLIYYGELENYNLNINCVNVENNYKVDFIYTLKPKENNDDSNFKKNYFLNNFLKNNYHTNNTIVNGAEMGWIMRFDEVKLEWIKTSYLGISANFYCCSVDQGGFKDTYSLNLESHDVSFFSTDDLNNDYNKRIICNNLNNIEMKSANEKSTPYFTKKTDKEFELYFKNGNENPIKISNTQKYTPRVCMKQTYKDFDYIDTKNGKLVFSFINKCTDDIISQQLFIVNKDGTFQRDLGDFFISYNNFAILRSNNEFATLVHLNNKNEINSTLVTYLGTTNKRTIIADDVDYFELLGLDLTTSQNSSKKVNSNQSNLVQEDKLITIINIGQGKNEEEAKIDALKNSIELIYKNYISPNTEFLNDKKNAEEINKLSNGIIQSYKTFNETQFPNGNWSVSLNAIVSLNKLISFVEAKGIVVEIKGGSFATNIKQQVINEQSEIKMVYEMVGLLHEPMQTAFDYFIKKSDPKSTDAESKNWAIPIVVTANANKNMNFCANFCIKTLTALSLNEKETEDYKSKNKEIYHVNILYNGKENNFYLRKQSSIEALNTLTGNWEFYTRSFKVESGIDEIIGKGEGKIFEFNFERYLKYNEKIIRFLSAGQQAATFTWEDKRTLQQIDKITEYIVKPIGITSKYKEGGFVVREEDGHGIVVTIIDLGILEFSEAKKLCEELEINGYRNWRIPNKIELHAISNLFKNGIGNFDGYYWSSNSIDEDGNNYLELRKYQIGGFKIKLRAVRSY